MLVIFALQSFWPHWSYLVMWKALGDLPANEGPEPHSLMFHTVY
jgi:hypothetical protein